MAGLSGLRVLGLARRAWSAPERRFEAWCASGASRAQAAVLAESGLPLSLLDTTPRPGWDDLVALAHLQILVNSGTLD